MITELITLQNQIRIFHWQTTSFSQHEAFGKTYEALNDLIDEYVETFMGLYGRVKLDKTVNINLVDLSNNIDSTIDKYIDYLQNSLTKDLSEKDTDLMNIRDEMLGELNKLKYLLTLK
jgi:DNA-binding ferritin-like protein